MEVLGSQECKREGKLGMGGVHPSSAYQMFDEMSSPHELFEEDFLLVMKEGKVSRDKADFNVSIMELTPTTEAAPSSPPLTTPSPMPTKCSMACLNIGITCTTSSSSLLIKMHVPSTTMGPVVSEDKHRSSCINTTDLPKVMPAKCSTLSFDIITGTDQAEVVFQIMMSASKVVPTSVQSVDNFSSRIIIDIKHDTSMHIRGDASSSQESEDDGHTT
uniref:Uncharacterized protein n=1 Tax=Leersia perrieri TaxID=77586 RepID=A0A0D9WYY5_9ORYZ